MLHFEREFFNEMSTKEKRKYIDILLKRGARMNPEELKVATREQKKTYINLLISQIKDLERHEIEAATDKQMKDYINKKRWVSIAEYEFMPEKFQKMYIDMAIFKRTGLNDNEFDKTPKHLRKYFAKNWFEKGYEMTPRTFSYLEKDLQKKYIDMVLSAGNKLILDFIPEMKPGVKTYYNKSLQAHPYLWESNVRNYIRKQLLEMAGNKKKVLPQALKDNEIFHIIDSSKAPGTTPMEGACWIVADALNIAFGYPVYVVYNGDLGHIDHFVVKVGNQYLDGRGFQGEKGIIDDNFWHWDVMYQGRPVKNDEQGNPVYVTRRNMRLIKFDPSMSSLAKDIVQDLKASQEMAEFIKQQVNGENI